MQIKANKQQFTHTPFFLKNDVGFISLKKAAKISGYAPDYIGWLIRKGKIEGKKVYSEASLQTTKKAVLAYKNRNKKTKEKMLRTAQKKPQQFISLKEAAKISGYAPDYIGWLIRKGKIPGGKIYNEISWRVNEASLKGYQKSKHKQKRIFKTIELRLKLVKKIVANAFSLNDKIKRHRIFNVGWRFSLTTLIIFFLVSGFSPIKFLHSSLITAITGGEIKTINFYTTLSSGDWQNSENIQGPPDVLSDDDIDSFSEKNSAIYKTGPLTIICQNFEEIKETTSTENILVETSISTSETTTTEETTIIETIEAIDTTTTEEIIEATTTEATTTEATTTEITTTEAAVIEATSTEEQIIESLEEITIPAPDTEGVGTEQATTSEAPTSLLNKIKNFFGFKVLAQENTFSAKIKLSFAIGEKTPDIIIEQSITTNKTQNNNTFSEESLSFWDKVKRFFENLVFKANLIVKAQEDEGRITNETTSLEQIIEEKTNAENTETTTAEITIQEINTTTMETSASETTTTNVEETIEATTTETVIIEATTSEEKIPEITAATIEATSTEEIISNLDAKVRILWSLDGQDWQLLGTISDYPQSNALNGGYFEYDASFLKNFEDVKNLKIKFEGIVGGESLITVYLDSAWVEITYQEEQKEEKEYELRMVKKDWRVDETPFFEIVEKGEKTEENIIEKLIGQVSSVFKEKPEIKVRADISIPQGEIQSLKEDEDFRAETHSPTKVTIFKPEDFRPGLYQIKIDFEKNGKIYNFEQDFTWGVLAINVNKSIYALEDERAYVQMGALDDEGHTICDAELELRIMNQELGIEAVLSTGEGTIQYSGKCGPNNVTDVPDYFSYYELPEEIGIYEMKLTAHTENGTRTITDSFEVREQVSFDVERIGPTRIYPPAIYEMTLKIKVDQDFQGQITEEVPESFAILTTQPLAEVRPPLSQDGRRKILWQVDWKKGESYELKYQFDASDVSPYIYLLGPLEFYGRSSTGSGRSDFFEIRSWQIASDDPGDWLEGWDYRKKITIDETKVDADLTNFPVLVKLASSTNFDFSKARSDGYDVRFTKDDGTTLLDYERERHNATTGTAEYWVKTNASSTASTTFYIYYGNSGASDVSSSTAVWDGNFLYVHHLGSLNGEVFDDSTSNNKDATRSNSGITVVDAKIGQGAEFNRTTANERASIATIGNLTAFTFEMWFLPNQPQMSGMWGVDMPYGSPNWTKPAGFTGAYLPVGIQFPTGTSEPYTLNSLGRDASWTEDAWNHAIAIYDGTYARVYAGGSEITGSPINASGTCTGWARTHYIGYGGYHWDNNEKWFDGILDEVRISNIARSAAWIKADYNSGNDSLVSYGEEETEGGGGSITISGTVYANEGIDALLTGPIINLYTTSTFVASTTASTTDGSYSFINVSTVSGDTLTVYIDNDSATGTTVTLTDGSTNITDMDIYQNHIIVRDDNVQTGLSIADMVYWDKDNDIDVKFTATTTGGNTLTVDSPYKLYIWGSLKGKFKPNGNITAYDLKIASSTSVYTASGIESIVVSGSWHATSSTNFVAASSTVNFTSTASGKTITTGGSSFYNLTFNGSDGLWTFQDAATTTNDLTITAGTASSTYNMYVYGGDVTGNGSLNWTNATFTVAGTGNFGGTSAWNFYNLTFSGTTTATSTGTTTISNVLTISSGQSLNGGINPWVLSGSGTPFVKTGTFTPATSNFYYISTADATITAATYYNLNLSPAGTPTYRLGSGTLTTNNYLTIGDGTNGVTVNADNNDPALDINGDFTISTSSVFIASQTGTFNAAANWSNTGIFTNSTGTVIFDAVDTDNTVNNGNSSFYNLTFNNASGGWTLTADTTTTNNFTITDGGATSTYGTLCVGGSWSNSGTFRHNSGTVLFDAVSAGKTITTGGFSFYNLTFNGSDGLWTFQDAATTTNDLTITAGTASSTYNMYVYGGDVTGNGSLNWTNATFTVAGTGNFGGTSAWNFYNLTFGDGSTSATTTNQGAGTTTISSILTIDSNHALEAGEKTWILFGSGTPFIKTGSLISATSTFRYSTNDDTYITAATYYNLELIDPPIEQSEMISKRTETSKTYFLGHTESGKAKYFWQGSISPIHYKDNPDDGAELWKEIDTTLVKSRELVIKNQKYDWGMEKADYHVYFKENFNSGKIVKFEKQKNLLEIEPGNLNWNYKPEVAKQELISEPKEVVGETNENKIYWKNAYGQGLDFEWIVHNTRLEKHLIINNLSDLPQSQNPEEATLELNLSFEFSNGLTMEETKNKTIEFMDKNGKVLFGFSPLRYWDSNRQKKEGVSEFNISKEQMGNKKTLSIKIPYAWLKSAIYPVYIDATVEEQVGASGDDAIWQSGTGFFNTTILDVRAGNSNGPRNESCMLFRDLTVSGTISSAVLRLYGQVGSGCGGDGIKTKITANDTATPSMPTTEAEADGLVTTTAKTDWDRDSYLTNNVWNDSPDISAVLQELVDSYIYDGDDDVLILWKDDGTSFTWYNPETENWETFDNTLYADSYDESSSTAPKLYIEYEAEETVKVFTLLDDETFYVLNNFLIGDSINSLIVTASTTDQIFKVDGNLTISASSTFIAPSSSLFTIGGNWSNQGTFIHSTGTVTFIDPSTTSTISGATTFYNLTSTTTNKVLQFSTTTSATTTVEGTLTLDGDNCGTTIKLRSTDSGSQWYLNALATTSINYVDVKDSYAITALTANSSLNSGNNTNWTINTCGIIVSGKVYSDEGASSIGADRTVRIKVNGTGSYSTSTTVEGDYSIDNVGISTIGDVLTVFLDAGTYTEKANTITLASSTSENITGLNLYQNRIIARHENSGPLTIADLDQYDSVQDSDILYTASSGAGTLTASLAAEFFVWSGKTFGNYGTNGVAGTTTFIDLDIRGTFTASSTQNIYASSTWYATSTAVFNAASSTVIFTSTLATTTIKTAGSPFYNLAFNGSDGLWTFQDAATTTNDLTVINGTASSTYNMYVYGDVTGNGTGILNWTGGTFLLDGAGYFGGTSNWNFYNLTFGDGNGVTQTTAISTGTTTVSNLLTVADSQTLDAGEKPWILSGSGTPFVKTGTFTAATSTFYYTAAADATVTAATYYNLSLSPADTPTYNLGSGTPLVVNNYLTIGNGTNGVTVNADNNDPILDINGDFTISTSSTFVASQTGGFTIAGSWLNQGTFTHSNGTTTFDATTPDKTINPGNSAFYNLTFDGSDGVWTFSDNSTTSNNFTISNGTVIATTTLYVGGNWSATTTGVFAHNNGEVMFIATDAGHTISDGGWPFYILTFNGENGEWLYQDSTSTAPTTTTVQAGTPTFLNAKTGGVSVTGGILNVDWYLGTHVVDKDNADHNINTGDNDITVGMANGAGDWLEGWDYRKKITIDEAKVDADLTNFPVLVKLASSTNFDFAKARNDGYDIRFTKDDETTLLDFERERYSTTTGNAEFWVKIPSVASSTASTTFYMYYGNSGASDISSSTAVWDTNYKGVWHLGNGTTLSNLDSTTLRNLTLVNTPTAVAGKIGGGMGTDGSNKYASFVGLTLSSDFTLSIWANSAVTSGNITALSMRTAPYLEIWAGDYGGGGFTWKAYSGTFVSNPHILSGITATNGTWFYLTLVRASGVNTLYVDGVARGTPYSNSESMASTTSTIGARTDASLVWSGSLDETRLSNTARSAAWVKADYNSGNDSLLTYGSEEEGGSGEAMVWKHNGVDWGTASSTQTTGSGADGKNPQPNSEGAIRVREYSKTAATATFYKYNLTIVGQPGFDSYDYYSDYDNKYITSASSAEDEDKVISQNWHRSVIGSMNEPYAAVNEPPANGSWHAGMTSDLQFSITPDTVNLDLTQIKDFTATSTITLSATTSYSGGFIIKAHMEDTQGKLATTGAEIIRFDFNNNSPGVWDVNCNASSSRCGFGYTTDDSSLPGTPVDRFVNPLSWAGFAVNSASTDPVATGGTGGESYVVTLKASVNSDQKSGQYTGTITFIATANY